MSTPLHGTWTVDHVDPATVERLAATHARPARRGDSASTSSPTPTARTIRATSGPDSMPPATSVSPHQGPPWSSAATSANGSPRSSPGTSKSVTTTPSSPSNSVPLSPEALSTALARRGAAASPTPGTARRLVGRGPRRRRSRCRGRRATFVPLWAAAERWATVASGVRRMGPEQGKWLAGLVGGITSVTFCQGEGRGFESRRPLQPRWLVSRVFTDTPCVELRDGSLGCPWPVHDMSMAVLPFARGETVIGG